MPEPVRAKAAPEPIDVFICYRQGDRDDIAAWLHDQLHQRELSATDGSRRVLRVYLDRRVPGVTDWRKSNRSALEESALIVICTRLLTADFRKQHGVDWVHHELDWWCEHRADVPPILIETQRQDRGRIVPRRVAEQWPDVNGVLIDDLDALRTDSAEAARKLRQLELSILDRAGQLLDVRLAEKDKQLAERERSIASLRRLTVGLLGAGVCILALMWLTWRASQAKQREYDEKSAALTALAAKQRLSEALRFLADSERALESDPALALLLAVESAAREPGRQSNEALYAALGANGVHRALDAHEGVVTALDFTPDSKTLLTGGSDGFACAWDIEKRTLLGWIEHEISIAHVCHLASTPNAMSIDYLGQVRVWSMEGGRTIASYQLPLNPIPERAELSRDGRTLFLPLQRQDKQGVDLVLLNPLTGETLSSLPSIDAQYVLLPDGATVFALDSSTTPTPGTYPPARWLDARSGALISSATSTAHESATPSAPPGAPHWLDVERYFAPRAASSFVVGWSGKDAVIDLWERGSAVPVRVRRLASEEPFRDTLDAVALSPSGELLVIADDAHVGAIDLTFDVPIVRLDVEQRPEHGSWRRLTLDVSVAADDQTVALRSDDWLEFWNVRTGDRVRHTVAAQSKLERFSPSAELYATIDRGRVSLWDVSPATLPRVPRPPGERAALARRPTTRSPITSNSSTLGASRAESSGSRPTQLSDHVWVLGDSWRGTEIIDPSRGVSTAALTGGKAVAESIRFTTNERYVVAATLGSVSVYDLLSGEHVASRQGVISVQSPPNSTAVWIAYGSGALVEILDRDSGVSHWVELGALDLDSGELVAKYWTEVESSRHDFDEDSAKQRADSALAEEYEVDEAWLSADGETIVCTASYDPSNPDEQRQTDRILALVAGGREIAQLTLGNEHTFMRQGGRHAALLDRELGTLEVVELKPGLPRVALLDPVLEVAPSILRCAPDGSTLQTETYDAPRSLELYAPDGRHIAELRDLADVYPRYDLGGERVLTRPTADSLRVSSARNGGELVTLKLDRALESSSRLVRGVFSPDGARLWTRFASDERSGPRTAALWDLSSGRRLSTRIPVGTAFQRSFDSEGEHFVTALSSGDLEIHRLPEWELAATLPSRDGPVEEALYLANPVHVLCLHQSGALVLWNVAERAIRWRISTMARATLVRGGPESTAAVVAEEGAWLVDLVRGQVLAHIDAAESEWFREARFSLDGNMLWVTHSGGRSRALPLDALGAARSRLPRALTPAEIAEYRVDEPCAAEDEISRAKMLAARAASVERALEGATTFGAARLALLSRHADLGTELPWALLELESRRRAATETAQAWVDELFRELTIDDDVRAAIDADSAHEPRVRDLASGLTFLRRPDMRKLAEQAWKMAFLDPPDYARMLRIAEHALQLQGAARNRPDQVASLPLAFARLKCGENADELLPALDVDAKSASLGDLRLALVASLRWFEDGANRNASILVNRLRETGRDLDDARREVELAWFGSDLQPFLESADPRAALSELAPDSDLRRRGLRLLDWRAQVGFTN